MFNITGVIAKSDKAVNYFPFRNRNRWESLGECGGRTGLIINPESQEKFPGRERKPGKLQTVAAFP